MNLESALAVVASEASFVIDTIISSELINKIHSFVTGHAFLCCSCKCHCFTHTKKSRKFKKIKTERIDGREAENEMIIKGCGQTEDRYQGIDFYVRIACSGPIDNHVVCNVNCKHFLSLFLTTTLSRSLWEPVCYTCVHCTSTLSVVGSSGQFRRISTNSEKK